jgi:hypothetical protein
MLKRLARFALLASFLATTAPVSRPASTAPALDRSAELTARTPEVKLRKLHLVRPDLIPYPVFFEVYA